MATATETLVSKRFSLTENSRPTTTLSAGFVKTSFTGMLFPRSFFSDRGLQVSERNANPGAGRSIGV